MSKRRLTLVKIITSLNIQVDTWIGATIICIVYNIISEPVVPLCWRLKWNRTHRSCKWGTMKRFGGNEQNKWLHRTFPKIWQILWNIFHPIPLLRNETPSHQKNPNFRSTIKFQAKVTGTKNWIQEGDRTKQDKHGNNRTVSRGGGEEPLCIQPVNVQYCVIHLAIFISKISIFISSCLTSP